MSTILLNVRHIEYPVKHSIDIAIICEIVAMFQNWSFDDRLILMAAAFTQNIAMVELQGTLNSQSGPLNQGQSRQIKVHPASALDILQQLKVKDENWLKYVAQHHEAQDGSGYPSGLVGYEINPHSLLISMADFYCAKITGRSYRSPMTSRQAMQFVFQGNDSRINSNIAQLFIKVLGIFLPGSFVELNNGEVSIVTHRGEKAHSPIVRSIVKQNNERFSIPVKRDTSDEKFSIKKIIPHNDINIKINRYQLWGSGGF